MSSETDSPRPPTRSGRDFPSRRLFHGLFGDPPGDFLSGPGSNDDVNFPPPLETLPTRTRLLGSPSMTLRTTSFGSRHSQQLLSEPPAANVSSLRDTLNRGVQPPFSRSTRRSTQSRNPRHAVAFASTTAVVAPPAAASRPRTRRSTRVATMACAARAAAMSSLPKDDTPSKRHAASRKRPPPESSSPSPPKKPRSSLKKPPVNAKNDADYEDAASAPDTADASCCICMCEPKREEVSTIDGCEHMFCFGCIGKWADRENSCPLCKKRFTKITRVHPAKRKKGGKKSPNSKRVKQRDQRSDYISGTSLEGLLASLATSGSMPGGARMSRFIVARMGVVGGPPSMPASRGARVTFSLDQFMAEADDDDDDFSQFNFFMHSHTASSSRANAPFAASVAARSYATNSNDRTAGRNPSNPLEIDDSDDDVEILHVSRSA